RNRREIIDEIQRVLDLVCDAGGELSERGEFFGLHQAILSGAQVLQGFYQFACSRLHAFEKSRILDRQHRLGGEGLQELDGALGKVTRFLATDYEGAHDLFCAKKWNVQQGTESGADDNIKRRRRIVLNIRDLDRHSPADSFTNSSLAETDMASLEFCDDRII